MLETPPELLDLRKSRVILDGQGQLTIENHNGLLEYTAECIRVRAGHGEICVDGSSLMLSVMDPGLIEITGRIKSVRFI
jgi:sporulation protein YqfC